MMTLSWESRLSALDKFFIKLPCDQNITHTLKKLNINNKKKNFFNYYIYYNLNVLFKYLFFLIYM